MTAVNNKTYDVVVIGAGSVGNPAAMFLAQKGARVLVIETLPSPGQGQNKAAIGGVRATHSDPAKISLGLRSLEIFSTFEEEHGIDLGWKKGGYCFPVFDGALEGTLKGLLETQQSFGLDIDWHDADFIAEIIPGINRRNLVGGTYSPGDGQVSPIKAADAFCKIAKQNGAEYRFNEKVIGIDVEKGAVRAVKTDKATYPTGAVLNAAGADAREIGALAGLDLPVFPDSHEAGITAPMKQFLGPLIIDMRPGLEGKTANFYFGQNSDGRIIFCYTPKVIFPGSDRNSTSEFLPVIARRLIDVIPALANMLVRRTWRGLYPMTPDGVPIVGAADNIKGMYLGAGMCGQGFMLGPGIAEALANLIMDGDSGMQKDAMKLLDFHRDFESGKTEALK